MNKFRQWLAEEQEVLRIVDVIKERFTVDPGIRCKRQPVHEHVTQRLGITLSNENIQKIKEALSRLGVLPVVARGYKYYRGLRLAETSVCESSQAEPSCADACATEAKDHGDLSSTTKRAE